MVKNKKVYYVGILDYMGFDSLDFYFSELGKAEEYFNQLLKKAKKHESTVKDKDMEVENFSESPDIDVLKDKQKPRKIHNVVWNRWHKISYEYDEWETYPDTIFLKEIKLDFEVDAKINSL